MTEPETRYLRGRDGTRLASLEAGEGRPVIMLHGYFGSAASMLASRPAASLIERGRRVIVPDLRGHGDSARPHDAESWPADVLADDGLALIEQLGLAEYDLAGYSLGGRTVVRMLVRGAAPGRAVVGGQGLEAVLHTVGRGGMFRRALAESAEPGTPERQMRDSLCESGGDPVALLRLLDSFVNTTPEELAAITVPVLVVTGEQDGHNDTAAALAAALPHGRYQMLPGDHGSVLAAPEYESALTAFLTGS